MAKAVSMEPIPTTTWWIYLLEGIGAVLIGILLLTAPAATVVAITLFLGFYWLFVGVLELVRMFVDRSVPWYWSLLIGLIGIAAGLLVLNHPLFAAVILPATLVACDALVAADFLYVSFDNTDARAIALLSDRRLTTPPGEILD